MRTSARGRSSAVPERRLRSGSRPGQISAELRAAIAAEADKLDQIRDTAGPFRAIEAVGNAFAALDDALDQLAVPRLKAIAELRRQGWSYDRIADDTTLSKPRVAQLAREAKRRGL